MGVIKGDTRSLDYGSCDTQPAVISTPSSARFVAEVSLKNL